MTNSKLARYLSVGLIVLGFVFILYGFKDSITSYILRDSVNKEMVSSLEVAFSALPENGKVNQDTVWYYPTDEHEPIKNRKENTNEHASVGAFIIPKLDETMAIMEGVGGNNLFRGASKQYQDQTMGVGNYVLTSHYMYDGSLFGRLSEVEDGDEVYVTDFETVYKYEVIHSDNAVETTQTHLLEDTKESILTFYGCTSDGTMRVVKRAKLIGYSLISNLGENDKELLSDGLN